MKLTSSLTGLMLGGVAAAAVGYCGGAFGQGITPLPSPVGTERITVVPVGPGGTASGAQAEVNINQIRNATGYLLFASSATASGTITVSTATNEILANVQPNTSTWVLPAKGIAFDSEQFQFCNVSGAAFSSATPVTIAAGTSTSITQGASNSSTITAESLGSMTCIELVFDFSTSNWYRIR